MVNEFDNQNEYNSQPLPPKKRQYKQQGGFEFLSLTLGVVALITYGLYIVSAVFGLFAVILGLMTRKDGVKAVAWIGIITGFIAVFVPIYFILALFVGGY